MSGYFTQPICEQVWNKKYRYVKENESVEEFYKRQALALIEDKSSTDDFGNIYGNLYSQAICFGGRIQYALGTDYKNQTFSNCFTARIAKDSLDEIMNTQVEFAKTMQAGGGVGCNFSILRPKGTLIRKANGTTSGVIEFMKGFDAYCATIRQGKNRRGAMIGVLEVWHPEIIDFIKVKGEKGMLNNFNISVGITDDFMEAVENDDMWQLIFPDLDDIDYDDMWDGNIKEWLDKGYAVNVYKSLPARELYDMIKQANYDYAEPGVIFLDTVNRHNNLWQQEDIRVSNPCGEEPLYPYNSCNLGAINLTKVVKYPFDSNVHPLGNIKPEDLKYYTREAVKYLDKILDLNYYPLDKYKEQAMQKRAIGLGIMGFGSMLNMLCVEYGSERSLEIAGIIGSIMLNEAYSMSADLAKEKGTFPAYNQEEIEKSTTFNKLTEEVQDKIRKYGLRNSRLLTIAPTGSTAILAQNVSGGVEPLFALEYTRKVREDDDTYREEKVMDYSWWLYQEMFGKTKVEDAPDYFKATASKISPEKHIEMQAEWQQWIDASISKTINVPVDIDFNEFKLIYMTAWKKELKGCTIYRPNDIVGSILSTNETTVGNKAIPTVNNLSDNLYKIELKSREPAIRDIVLWKNKSKVYIVCTITEDGYPLEVFTKLPKDAGEGMHQFERDQFFEYVSNWDAICREASLLLRYGVPLHEIVKQFNKSAYSMHDCSAILARILKTYPANVTVSVNDDVEEPTEEDDVGIVKDTYHVSKGSMCPECGGRLIPESGCVNCYECGYSRCS